MRLDGRRESSNVDDRRSLSGGAKAGMGIGGLVVVALITWFMGGNPLSVLQNADMGSLITTGDGTQREMTAEEEELAKFSRQILASTEDVWTKVFQQYGRTYQAPTMVLFTNSVRSGCGQATASVGPFYCSADQCLYIDLSFFSSMRQQLGADGDFAYAYVIAHEVGHHVQYLLGTLDSAHDQMARVSETQSNRISVRIELQADYYAGVWGYYENQLFRSLEQGDVEEAINCSLVIGDDYLQKKAQGYAVPESFNHGTSEQRRRWLTKGLTTGDMTKANTFELSDSQL
ncbi:MAG: neutral zinc metallopeptidase [Bacteroidaceae bacterium]|nr:neutral zinc metallopeptidase [Bacteroidaceae bacterium]MBR3014249.1 neutral zinc metallopeptidase [Bacteroidaceae bacterium]